MKQFEDHIKEAYEQYLLLPLATIRDCQENEIYKNRWHILTGRACVSPHPHRHYSLTEFAFFCGKEEALYEKFLKPILTNVNN